MRTGTGQPAARGARMKGLLAQPTSGPALGAGAWASASPAHPGPLHIELRPGSTACMKPPEATGHAVALVAGRAPGVCQVGRAALLSPALSWNPAPLSPAGARRSQGRGESDPDTSGPRQGSRGWVRRGKVAVAGGRRHSRLVGVPLQQGPLGAGALRPRAHGAGHDLCGLLEGGQEGFPCGACTERQGDDAAPAALPLQEPSLRGPSCDQRSAQRLGSARAHAPLWPGCRPPAHSHVYTGLTGALCQHRPFLP